MGVLPDPAVLALTARRDHGAAGTAAVDEHPGAPLALPAGLPAGDPDDEEVRRPVVPGPRRPVSTASLVALKNRIDVSHRRRRRIVALVGITGIIASGAGWLSSSSTILPSQPGTEPLASNTQWISEAGVRLAAIDRQLDAIAQAEATYETRLAPQFAGKVPPKSVTRLQERKSLLMQQKAALRSQVATVEQVDSAATDLADTEKQLADLDDVLESSAAPTRSQDQADALAALNEQRDLLQRRRDAKKEDLDRLEKGATSAKSSPLPEPDERANELAAAVIDLVENPGSHRDSDDEPTGDERYTPPSVLASGRESSDRRGPSHTTSEPGEDPEEGLLPVEPPGPAGADPTGSGTGPGERGGVLDTTKGGLGRALGGPDRSAAASPSADAPGTTADAEPGLPGRAGDGIGDVLDGPGEARAGGRGGPAGRGPGGPGGAPAAEPPAAPGAAAPGAAATPAPAAPAPAEPGGGGLLDTTADGLGDVLDGPETADPGPAGERSAGRDRSADPGPAGTVDDERSRPRGKAARNAGGASSDSSDSGPVLQQLGGSTEPAVVSPSELRSSSDEAQPSESGGSSSSGENQPRRARSGDGTPNVAPADTPSPTPDESSRSRSSSAGASDDVMVDKTVDVLKDFTAENPDAAGSVGLHEGMSDDQWESAARSALKTYADYDAGSSDSGEHSSSRSSESGEHSQVRTDNDGSDGPGSSSDGSEHRSYESATADSDTADIDRASSQSYSSGGDEHRSSSSSSSDGSGWDEGGHDSDGESRRSSGSAQDGDRTDGDDSSSSDSGGYDDWARATSDDGGGEQHDSWTTSSDDGGHGSWDDVPSNDGDQQRGTDDDGDHDSGDRDSQGGEGGDSWSSTSNSSDDGGDSEGGGDSGGGDDGSGGDDD